MKPVDPRLVRRARPVRAFLAALAGIGTLDAVLLVVQATLLADLVSRLVLTPDARDPYAPAVIGLVAASLGRAALAWMRESFAARTSTAVKAALRADLISSLIRGPARAADRERTGEAAVLATRGIDALDGYFSRYLPQLALAAIVPAVVGARILAADPISALIIALTVPLIPVFMVLIGLMTRDHLARRWNALERLGGHFLEVVAGLPTLVAFGRAEGQRAAIRRAAEAHRRETGRTLRVAFLSSLVLELIAMLSVALVAVAIGLRLADGGLSLRTGLLVLICAPEVYLPLRLVGARYHEAAEGLAATERIFALTDAEQPQAGLGTAAGAAGDGGAAAGSFARAPRLAPATIRFEGVRVNHEGRGVHVVPDLEIPLAEGRVTALVGPSGAGKTTLLHLLLGFDTLSGGRITVGGEELTAADLTAWRRQSAWLPQRPRLTGRTVADAIRLGRPDATEADLARAARAAGIDFPLDTPLGRDGTAVSGGQARRVALARAILRNAALVLLDEPTEHLDPETERSITAALRAWLPGRTALLITHRPALLEFCDTIVRIDGPRGEYAQQAAATQPALCTQTLAPSAAARPPAEPPAESDEPGSADSSSSAGDSRGAESSSDTDSSSSADDASSADSADSIRSIRGRLLAAIGLAGAAALCSVGLAAASAWLIATAALRPPLLTLQVGIAAVQAFGFGRATLRYAERLAGHDATLRLLAGLRVDVYRGLVRRAPAAMAAEHGGDLLANLTSDIEAAQDLFLKVLLPSAGAVVSCAGLLLFDLLALPGSALILLLGLGVGALAVPALARATGRGAERRTAQVRSLLAQHTVDLLGALPDLVAYGAAERQAELIAQDDRRLTALERRGALAGGLGQALNLLAAGATCAALAVIALDAARSGRAGGPVLAAVVLAPIALFELLAALPDAARGYDRGRAGWERLHRIADAPRLVAAPLVAQPLAWTDTSVLEFDRVTAAWPDPDTLGAPVARPAVQEVSFTVHAGEHIELSGPSGAGKSTVAALAARYLDPVRGAVRIDGTDLRETDPDDVRALVAVCGQDAHLFDTSIRENLRIADPAATEAQLWRALAAVRLDDWVRSLPSGWDTAVGQLGDAVSGGERQRIALARALLSPAPIVVLDEPLAHLDAETAAAVEQNLRRELSGRTVVWIRHAAAAAPHGQPGQSGQPGHSGQSGAPDSPVESRRRISVGAP
ncbi:thiol reductant ABC exporter subunit CydD [Actinocrinis puniceicyclus]|uniref:Thiol reductant ABC exporter subunit CydD n=1 Tax=Actinocrinis puniceicyclus TaxID=977794 RepID=A0A8J7WL61_9ACTN|nr:thiol reductant ABC exporter subunit CydD [Actinocrinis puniceicyclus]MBS2961515.1 thiol reductant ABC exporter subunit CydD [Actinocrinis puniceicyclus]